MIIAVTLMGGFKELTPDTGKLELDDASSITDALKSLGIDPARAQVVLVNGRPQADHAQALSDEDQITVIPLVGGG